jgi:hypothetical protein
MWKDEIVEETQRERDAYVAKFDYILEAIYDDLKAQEKASGRKVISLPPKQPLKIMLSEEGKTGDI